MAKLLGVSESTIYRRMRTYGLRKLEFTDIDDDLLTETVKKTLEDFPSCGERMLLEILRQKSITVSRLLKPFRVIQYNLYSETTQGK